MTPPAATPPSRPSVRPPPAGKRKRRRGDRDREGRRRRSTRRLTNADEEGMDQPRNIVRIDIEGKGREQIGAVMEMPRFPSYVSVSVS